MGRFAFRADLPPDEIRGRLRRAFEAQEDLIRRRLPAAFRGAFEGDDRFWIRVPNPHRSNQWNEAVLAARPVACALSPDGGATRVTVHARRGRWSLGVLSLGALAASGLLGYLLWMGGLFGRSGPLPGMRLSFGFSAGALACVLLGMLGAFLWGRPDPTPARMAVLRAAGLFGAGRGR